MDPQKEAAKEFRDLQSQLFDKSSSYTKLILGLAYGGFFAFWAGTKQYLVPWQIVSSALLMTLSLVLFITFEVVQAAVLSYLAIDCSKSISTPGGDALVALEHFRSRSYRATKGLYLVWFAVFPISVISGFMGAGILVWGWVHWLRTMK